jgi:hypothetical protein
VAASRASAVVVVVVVFVLACVGETCWCELGGEKGTYQLMCDTSGDAASDIHNSNGTQDVKSEEDEDEEISHVKKERGRLRVDPPAHPRTRA